jgi:hypothetical protein
MYTAGDLHNCKQKNDQTLQQYLQSFVKLRAQAPNVSEDTVIDAMIEGLKMGSCAEYLDRNRPSSEKELFDMHSARILQIRQRQKGEDWTL